MAILKFFVMFVALLAGIGILCGLVQIYNDKDVDGRFTSLIFAFCVALLYVL